MSCRLNRSDPAAIAGGYSTWTPPYCYNTVRVMQLASGLLTNGSCVRSGNLQELIHCKDGQIKLPSDRLKARCLELDLSCPDVSCQYTIQPCPTSLHWGFSQDSTVPVGITQLFFYVRNSESCSMPRFDSMFSPPYFSVHPCMHCIGATISAI